MAHPWCARRRPARAVAAIVGALALASTLVVARQTTYLKDSPGTWKPWKMTVSADVRAATAATAADLNAFEAHLVAFREILRQAPSAATPMGYSVEVWGHLRGDVRRAPGQPSTATLPIAGGVSFGAFSIYELERAGKRVRIDTGETALVQFVVNDISAHAIGHPAPPGWHVIEHDVMVQPPSTGERAGFPRYDGIVVITKRSAPLWTPVSLREAWELQLRASQHAQGEAQQVADRMQQAHVDQVDPGKKAAREAGYRRNAANMPNPTAYLAQMAEVERVGDTARAADVAATSSTMTTLRDATREVAAIEDILAALTPEDRVAPACVLKDAVRIEGRFRSAPDARCKALVRANHAFFDRSLPRSAPQLLLIQDAKRCHEDLREPEVLTRLAGNCAANRALLETWNRQAVLDWLH